MQSQSTQRDVLETGSRIVTLATLAAALVACSVALPLAMSWSAGLFPGFLLDPTLVVNGSGEPTWAGRQAGVNYPQHVERINGVTVRNSAEIADVLANFMDGQAVSVFTRLPNGEARHYPAIQISAVTARDMLRLFWLPYLVGAAYLAIGVWMYRLRGRTRPGRAFSFFCFNIALVCILLFDLSTTHAGVLLWTAAIAMAGGALVSLALRFPEEGRLVMRWPWLLAVPYALSLALALWGAAALHADDPWAYVGAWGSSYRYAALGVVLFLATTVYRAATSAAPAVRQQARIVLLGSTVAFTPVTIWFVAPLLGWPLGFDAALFLPSLLIFPLAVAIAIFRYRLLEVEVIVNRTIFYGLVTALLAGVFSVLISIFQRLFIALTGQKSDAAVIMATLLIVAMIDVARKRVQQAVDRQFKEAPDTTRPLKRFGEQARSLVALSDDTYMARSLLDEAAPCLRAQSGAVTLWRDGQKTTVHTIGRWTGDARLCIPLDCNGQRYGLLLLGPRADWSPYTRHECQVVGAVAADVAQSIRLARALNKLPMT